MTDLKAGNGAANALGTLRAANASDAPDALDALALSGVTSVFALPGPLFDVLPTAVYVCDQDGLVLRFNRRAAELWGRSPKLSDPEDRFCGSFRMYRADGRLLPHRECPMAEVVRTGVSVRDQEVTIERPDGSRGTALVNIEALRNADGEVVGAVNCFQDVSERKQAEAKMRILAREVDHRAKNLLSLVQATVHLTKADTVHDFKAAIEGRIKALSNAHTLLAESRWAGVDLRTLVTEELSPYCGDGASRAEIEGHDLILKPQSAQTIAMVLHELTTNAVKYGALSVASGRIRVEWLRPGDGKLVLRWKETKGPPVKPPARQGFGTRVIASLVRTEKGAVLYDWCPDGLACEISIQE
jgi:PAS domain S-box-containing protein